jgi:hypothetical protein
MSNRRRPVLMNLYRSEFLRSRAWFARRDRWFTEETARGGVLACAACGQRAKKTQLELHHLDYSGVTVKEGRWLAFERHEDLLPLHRTCHDLLHRLIDRDEVLAYHDDPGDTDDAVATDNSEIEPDPRYANGPPPDPSQAPSAPIGGGAIDWSTLEGEDARKAWAALREWVEWFTVRYRISESTVPACWWKHGQLVEELSALHIAHRAAFHSSDSGFGPIGWHERLSLTLPRLTRAYAGGCARGHDILKPRSWASSTDEQEWDAWTTQAHAH